MANAYAQLWLRASENILVLKHKIAASASDAATTSCARNARKDVLLLELEALEALIELGKLAASVHQPVNACPCRVGFGVDL